MSYVERPFLLWDYKRILSWFLLVCLPSLPPSIPSFLSPSLLLLSLPSFSFFFFSFLLLFHLNLWSREGTAEARSLFAATGFLPQTLQPLPVPVAVADPIHPRIQCQHPGKQHPDTLRSQLKMLYSLSCHLKRNSFFSSQDFSRAGQWSSCPFSWTDSEGRQPLLMIPGSPVSTQQLKQLPYAGAECTTAHQMWLGARQLGTNF